MRLLARMDLFALLETALAVQSKMLATDRAMQDATRAPRQARNKGWRPHGRLRSQPATPSKDCRFFVQKMGSTSIRFSIKTLFLGRVQFGACAARAFKRK